jgi:hypothetical protein
LRPLFTYVSRLVVVFIVLTGGVFGLLDHPTLTDFESAYEVFSLFVLILVNGELSESLNRRDEAMKHLNRVVLGFSILVLLLLCGEVVGVQFEVGVARSWLVEALDTVIRNLYWLSSLPIVAYAALDFYGAYGPNRDSDVSRKLITFVDLPCVLPLVLVYGLIALSHVVTLATPAGIRFFVAGATSVVLISSAVAAKAVEVYFSSQSKSA